MKKIFTYNTLLLSATIFLALAACSKNNEVINEPQNEDKAITETLTLKAETKVTMTDARELAWEDGDKIAVWTGTSDSSGEFQTCLVDSDLITVSLADASYHRFNYAVKYSGSTLPALSSGTLSITLPDEYDYDDVSGTKNPVPFVAKSLYTEGTTLSFRAVGALARIAVPGIPATANKLVVTFDKDVTGSFAVSGPDTAAPSIAASAATSKNVVTVNITPNTDYAGAVINIPVPTGSISVTSVVAKLDDAVIASVNSVVSGWNAARAHGKKATAAFAPSMASMVLAPGNLYTSSGTLAISPNCYVNIFNNSSVDDYNTSDNTKYSSANRTHFNCNELYFLMNSSGTGNMPSKDNATTNYDNASTYATLIKNDFGDGKNWHVPSQTDWQAIFSNTPSRPGSKLDLTIGSSAPVEKDNSHFLRITVCDYNGELGNGAEDAFCGFLLFPDNVALSATFVALDIADINKTSNSSGDATNTAFTRTKITKENLDKLISEGCAFLPAAGMVNNVAFSNHNLVCNYLSSTQSSASNDVRLRAQRNTIGYAVSTGKASPFCSVRLVRPVE